MVTQSSTKEPKPSCGKRRAFSTNGPGSTGSLYVEVKLIHSYLLDRAQVQVHQGTPHKTRYAESNTRKVRKNLGHICTGGKFLYRTPMAHALRSTTDKWNPIALKSFWKQRTLSIVQIGNPQIGKSPLPTLHLIEG